MIDKIRTLLSSGKIDVFLAYKSVEGHPLPHAFTAENLAELEALIVGSARYPLEKIAASLAAKQPGLKFGMIARDCNQRALNALAVWNQLDPDNVEIINVNCCPSNLKNPVGCSYLTPETEGRLKNRIGIERGMSSAAVESLDARERFNRWMYEFQKCIKCYGCRDICPMCFCRECALEHEDLIGTGRLPPEAPIFHLVRAVHMAGRCVDCGLCEEACPAEIPLRLLYRKANEIVGELFDYRPGVSAGQSPFQAIAAPAAPLKSDQAA